MIDGSKSNTRTVEAGIPQGSRLGPLLWILFVNDISENIESEILIFADDTSLFASAKDPTETALILNRDLEKIGAWAEKWKVMFNASKSKDIIFSKKMLFNSPPVLLNNSVINRVHQHRHLGIWLSSSQDWGKQIQETCLKANSKLAVLRSVKFLSRSTLDILYKLTVRSIIDYGLVIYYHTLKQTEMGRLAQIQYRAAKLCTGALHYTSQTKLEYELGWEPIEARAEFLGLCLFKKIASFETRPLIRTCMPQFNNAKQNRETNCF